MKSSNKKASSFRPGLCSGNTDYRDNHSYEEDVYDANNGFCCGIICIKSLAIIFNFLMILSGMLLVSLCVYTIYFKQNHVDLLSSAMYQISTYLLLAGGAVSIILGILGVVCSWYESRNLLTLYLLMLIMILFVQIAGAILLFDYRNKFAENSTQDMRSIITEQYGQPGYEFQTKSFDEFQQKFRCCGATDFTDWSESLYVESQRNSDGNHYNLVSESCCKSPSKLCAVRDHPSNINSNGCVKAFGESISGHVLLFSIFSVAVSFFQMNGVFISGLLIKRISQRRKYECINNSNEFQ